MKEYTNRLIDEDSPYLQQHAHNPLDWFPWANEAFEIAKKEGKLVFLSIGYSTCHWCHVMERESFENEKIAQEINKNYISIKVDKEEMPHIDKQYQDIHYLLQRRAGGWPLSIIMTPSKEVIFAATYLPPYTKNNMMGFSELTQFIFDKYKNDFDEVKKSVDSIKNAYARYIKQKAEVQALEKSVIDTFIANTKQNFDKRYKGIGESPKFPHASTFDTLIDIYSITNSHESLRMVLEAHNAMAKGGIYDQIEGGFYRYSVDEAWMIPHFEKMLYTNAELIESYSKLYRYEKSELYKEIVEDTIQAMKERFLKEGVFYSASDADSEGVEGRYFVFLYDEAKQALQKEGIKADEALEYFGISKYGNFEDGFSNPYIRNKKKPENIQQVKAVFKKLRLHIEYPFIDYKVLTSWNALLLSALFVAGKNIDEKYSQEALSYLDSLLEKLRVQGELYHQYIFGSSLKVKGLLEDYAFIIDTLLKAYNYSLDKKYLDLAIKLTQEALSKFFKDEKWNMSDDGFEALAVLEDASYKSALSKMLQNIAIVSLLCEDNSLDSNFVKMLEAYSGSIMKYPHAYSEAIKPVLMSLYGLYVIKTKRENILSLKKRLKKINYPYIYIKIENIEGYQACSFRECFFSGESLDELEESLTF